MSAKKSKYSIRKIFEDEFERFRQNKSFPLHVLKAVQAILDCRTPVYGGHMYGCPDDHFSLILFNSCKKRNCPTCQSAEIEYWNHVQKKRLLNTGHYQIVFKQPDLFHSVFLSNYKEYANLLFEASRDALKELLPSKMKAGVILQLHTHGNNNEIHPHVHCAITDGGMNEYGKYERFDGSLLSVERVEQIYQKHYLKILSKKLDKGLIIHNSSLEELTERISEKGVSVFVSNRYDSGSWLITYLARNSRGGSIKDNQLLYVKDGVVGYRYQNSEKKTVEAEMKLDTFIQRYLYHIPPDRYNTVRYCGLYATGCVEEYQKMRKQLNQEPYSKPEKGEHIEKELLECPVCKKKLIHQETFERNSIPFQLLKNMKFNASEISSKYWQNPEQRVGLKFHWSEIKRGSPLKAANYCE